MSFNATAIIAIMMSESASFSYLYEIARCLNKEFSLQAALKAALEKTVQLLELQTGWIWLMQENKSIYLAASYNLPPALRDSPEHLSGRCYCIEKYLSDRIGTAANISEIACTRLNKLHSGINDLKFHATVPIRILDQKVGLINLLSKEHQELSQSQLCILNTIGELIGIAIQRTRAQDARALSQGFDHVLQETLQRVFKPKLQKTLQDLEMTRSLIAKGDKVAALEKLGASTTQVAQLNTHLLHMLDESTDQQLQNKDSTSLPFPTVLTGRELELLMLVRKGYTNKQIAGSLFISERTVKFHMSSILLKLSAATRTEAVDIALKRGLMGF